MKHHLHGCEYAKVEGCVGACILFVVVFGVWVW